MATKKKVESKEQPQIQAASWQARVWSNSAAVYRWIRREWRQVSAGLLIAVVAIVALASLGIYGLGWQNWFTGAVSAVVPFPAAYSGNQAVSYRSYYRRESLLRAEAVKAAATVSTKELGDEALGQLMSEQVIAGYAKQHNISVSDAEVNAKLQAIFSADGGEKAAAAQLKATYGVREGQYRELLAMRLLQAKVEASLQDSSASRQAASDKAQSILKLAKSGTDFDQLASRYSQDLSGTQSGQAALRPVSSLPAPAQVAVVKLADGQLYDGVISSGTSYYLLKRVATVNGVPMVRQIVIPSAGLDEWLSGQMAGKKQVKLLPQLR